MSLGKVTLVHPSEDGLSQVQWHFYEYNTRLLVDGYEELNRPSLRHKFKTSGRWGRLSNIRENSIRREDVPLTEAIKVEAVEAFVAQMRAKLTVTFQA